MKVIRIGAAAILLALASPAFGGSAGYPVGANPVTASATGTTGVTSATLPAVPGQTTYICGFSIRANATTAVTGNATVTGTPGTLNFSQFVAAPGADPGKVETLFAPCVSASATNTAIAVNSPALGSGGVVSVSAWGFQN
jgi:hypothetical protein